MFFFDNCGGTAAKDEEGSGRKTKGKENGEGIFPELDEQDANDASDVSEQPQPMGAPHVESFNCIRSLAKRATPSLDTRAALYRSFAL